MTTSTMFTLGKMGQMPPAPDKGSAPASIGLPPTERKGGLPLMEALAARRSLRSFARDALPLSLLSGLLWAAYGINRDDGGRTAPSALNGQEIDVLVAFPTGVYRYDAQAHELQLVTASDLRRVTAYQDFLDEAPLDLVYVAAHARMHRVPAGQREAYAYASTGAIAQNVYLFCASHGLCTVVRAWSDREAIAYALGLSHDHQVLLTQTVGYPKKPSLKGR